MDNLTISKATIDFLKDLGKNNNKEWFDEHKNSFKKHQEEVKLFFETVKEHLNGHDEIEKMKMFRIYRDVRFSKDKTPYKTHLAASFSRLGTHLRGGYYIHLAPGNSFVATGFWQPNKEDLFRIRKELEMDASEFRDVIANPGLQKIWGKLKGEEVKTTPKGFDKDHESIDLIRKKQFIFVRDFADKEVLSNNFLNEVNKSFKAIRPYFDLMSEILTTNLNGESLLD